MLFPKPKPRLCGFCGQPVAVSVDTPEERKYRCEPCDAIETITKSKTSWWYHGWKAVDGRKLRTPTSAEMSAGIYAWQTDN